MLINPGNPTTETEYGNVAAQAGSQRVAIAKATTEQEIDFGAPRPRRARGRCVDCGLRSVLLRPSDSSRGPSGPTRPATFTRSANSFSLEGP